ncbi:MAG: hypothetical protein LUG86_07855 [Oscillospiraceae bacterium]|nr:hypothetical protein [Oscillospiraceae bacterium]
MSYRKLSTPEDVEQWVKLNYSDEEIAKITEYQNSSDSPLQKYKGGMYRWINSMVRGGYTEKNEECDIPELQMFLSSWILDDDIVVYRFVDLLELRVLLKNTVKHSEYTCHNFLSTTLLKKYYSMDDIKKHRFTIKIQVGKGSHGVYLPEINKDRPEYEILFPYDSKLTRIGWLTFRLTN